MGDKYLIALDISLACTGGCIFDKQGNPVRLFSIPTSNKYQHGERLKIIADYLIQIRKEYDIDVAIFEAGFSRFNLSTQAIFKATGVANYIFYDCFQVAFSSSTIKKIICGKGNVDKKQVQEQLKNVYPDLTYATFDESDACSIGYAYFKQKESGYKMNRSGDAKKNV